MIVAFTACVLLVALGDILSIASRAKIPAMAGIILLYLAATALGMPQDWPTLSGLAPLGDLMFPVFVAAVTTNILPRDVVRQWKFILIGCIAVGASMLVTVLAGTPAFLTRHANLGGACFFGAVAAMAAVGAYLYLRNREDRASRRIYGCFLLAGTGLTLALLLTMGVPAQVLLWGLFAGLCLLLALSARP